MANISSWVNKAGNFTHSSLITGSTFGATSHIGAGAAAGAVYGAAEGLYDGSGMIDGAVNRATSGAILGAGTRYASSKYGEGAFRSTMANHMGYTTPALAKRNKGLSASSTNFSMSNFTHSQNSPYWTPNETVSDNLLSQSFMTRYRG